MTRALLLLAVLARSAAADPALVAIAPAADGDARKAIAIGSGGEVYTPDGKGGWACALQIATADPLALAGRAGAAVVALGDGIVYRLAENGWSAIRLHQHGKSIMNAGPHAFAAVGRQLFALDRDTGGEPTKVFEAPSPILAIGAGEKGIVLLLDTGLFRLAGKHLAPLRDAPSNVRLVSDRWALVDHGVVDLSAMRAVPWPSGLAIVVATTGPDDAFVAVGKAGDTLELVTVRGGKLARDPLAGVTGTPVGVVVDRKGGAVVAFADGQLAVRDKAGWTTTKVTTVAPETKPGAPPAASH